MRGLYAPAPPHPPRSEAVSRLTSTCLLRRFASTVLSLASAQLRNSPHHKAAPRWRSNNPRRPSPVAAEEQRVPDRICSASHGSLGSAIRDTGPGQPAAQGMAALKWRRSVNAPAHPTHYSFFITHCIPESNGYPAHQHGRPAKSPFPLPQQTLHVGVKRREEVVRGARLHERSVRRSAFSSLLSAPTDR